MMNISQWFAAWLLSGAIFGCVGLLFTHRTDGGKAGWFLGTLFGPLGVALAIVVGAISQKQATPADDASTRWAVAGSVLMILLAGTVVGADALSRYETKPPVRIEHPVVDDEFLRDEDGFLRDTPL